MCDDRAIVASHQERVDVVVGDRSVGGHPAVEQRRSGGIQSAEAREFFYGAFGVHAALHDDPIVGDNGEAVAIIVDCGAVEQRVRVGRCVDWVEGQEAHASASISSMSGV
jgi:hypothetical protein